MSLPGMKLNMQDCFGRQRQPLDFVRMLVVPKPVGTTSLVLEDFLLFCCSHRVRPLNTQIVYHSMCPCADGNAGPQQEGGL